jgi:hypothetical protein
MLGGTCIALKAGAVGGNDGGFGVESIGRSSGGTGLFRSVCDTESDDCKGVGSNGWRMRIAVAGVAGQLRNSIDDVSERRWLLLLRLLL